MVIEHGRQRYKPSVGIVKNALCKVKNYCTYSGVLPHRMIQYAHLRLRVRGLCCSGTPSSSVTMTEEPLLSDLRCRLRALKSSMVGVVGSYRGRRTAALKSHICIIYQRTSHNNIMVSEETCSNEASHTYTYSTLRGRIKGTASAAFVIQNRF